MQLDQTIEQRKTTQCIRIFDIAVLAPALFLIGITHKNNFIKLFLVIIAIATFLYNFKRYILEKKYMDAILMGFFVINNALLIKTTNVLAYYLDIGVCL